MIKYQGKHSINLKTALATGILTVYLWCGDSAVGENAHYVLKPALEYVGIENSNQDNLNQHKKPSKLEK